MRILIIILCISLLKQSFATCSIGPLFLSTQHHTSTTHNGKGLSAPKTKSCCKAKSKSCKSSDEKPSKSSSEDGCGDECHCACCAKIIIYSLPVVRADEITIVDFINEEKISTLSLYSFDYSHNIVHPPAI